MPTVAAINPRRISVFLDFEFIRTLSGHEEIRVVNPRLVEEWVLHRTQRRPTQHARPHRAGYPAPEGETTPARGGQIVRPASTAASEQPPAPLQRAGRKAAPSSASGHSSDPFVPRVIA